MPWLGVRLVGAELHLDGRDPFKVLLAQSELLLETGFVRGTPDGTTAEAVGRGDEPAPAVKLQRLIHYYYYYLIMVSKFISFFVKVYQSDFFSDKAITEQCHLAKSGCLSCRRYCLNIITLSKAQRKFVDNYCSDNVLFSKYEYETNKYCLSLRADGELSAVGCHEAIQIGKCLVMNFTVYTI